MTSKPRSRRLIRGLAVLSALTLLAAACGDDDAADDDASASTDTVGTTETRGGDDRGAHRHGRCRHGHDRGGRRDDRWHGNVGAGRDQRSGLGGDRHRRPGGGQGHDLLLAGAGPVERPG